MMIAVPLLAVLIQTLGGTPIDALEAPAGAKALVYIFTSVDCPISNRYAPEIRRIVERYAPRGAAFRLVYPGRVEDAAAIREHMRSFGQTDLDAFKDPASALVKFTGATITPEAVLVIAGKVVYRGRIDDRYVDLGVERPAPTTHDLADALEAALAGRPVPHPTTQAVGCFIADLTR